MRESEAQEKAAGYAAHRCDIAKGPGQAFPADGICGMFVQEEVRAFQKPVAGENGFVASFRPKECSVVANA